MDFFIPLVIFLILFSFVFRKKKWLPFVLTMIPLILFWGTKVDFGPDYLGYQFKYDTQHNASINVFLSEALQGKFEPAFFLLLKVMPSFNSMVFLQATFLIVCVYLFFYEFLPKYSLPLALLLWLFNSSILNTFSAMRSSFLIGFFLLAVIAKMKDNNKIAIILTIVGAQFHMSGYLLLFFILLPRYFFKKERQSFTNFLIIFVFLALLVPSAFPSFLNFMMESSDNLSSYEDYVQETNYGLGFYFFSIVRLGFIAYILNLMKRNLIEDQYIWIAGLTILCYLLMMVQGINIMYRFFNYFFLITVVFKCYVLRIDKSVASKVYVGLSILYATYNFIGYFSNAELMPYYEHYKSFLF